MKKIVFFLLTLIFTYSYGQESGVGFTGGYASNGLGGQLTYYNALSEKGELQISLYGSLLEDVQEEIEIPYNNFSLNIGYLHKILRNRSNRFTLAIGGGGLIGYEVLNNGDNILENGAVIDGESQLIYGAYATGEITYFLSDNFALIGTVNEFYHANSTIGNLSFYGGIGIKYLIY